MNLSQVAKTPTKLLFHPLVLSSAVATTVVLGISGWLSKVPQAILPRTLPAETEVKSLLIGQLEGSTELKTSQVALETVVVASQERTLGQFKLGETRVIYQGIGQVSAGIDMSQIQVVEVDRNRGKIHLRLPSPYLVNTSLDVKRSNVLDRRKDWFGPNVETELHARAQRKALEQIEAEACQKGLFEQANTQAEELVEQILTAARYREIAIDTQSPAAGTCPL